MIVRALHLPNQRVSRFPQIIKLLTSVQIILLPQLLFYPRSWLCSGHSKVQYKLQNLFKMRTMQYLKYISLQNRGYGIQVSFRFRHFRRFFSLVRMKISK